jgi:hypothetical protein
MLGCAQLRTFEVFMMNGAAHIEVLYDALRALPEATVGESGPC